MSRLLRYLYVVLKWRKFTFYNTLALTTIAIVVSFILPHRYTATAQLLPPPEDDAFGMSSALGAGLGGGLGRLRAGMMGAAEPSDLMVGILSSRTVTERVVERCSIAQHYRVKRGSMERARKILREMTHLSVSDEGIVGIAVEAKTPQLAADVANCFVEELDSFLRHSNISRGRNARVFIERRLGQIEDELATAQESLKVFQQRHRVASVDEETEAAIGTYVTLMSQLYAKRAELVVLESVSNPHNPHVARTNREIRALRSQLAKLETGSGGDGYGVGFAVSFESLPSVSAEHLRRYRDFRVQEEAYSMLHQQYEYARILEARDAPTLTVLDYGVPPERRSYPRRAVIVLVVLVFSLVMGIAFAFISEYFSSMRAVRPAEYAGWQELRRQLVVLLRGSVRLLPFRQRHVE